MLKFMLMLMSLILLFNVKKSWHMINNSLFIMFFLFLLDSGLVSFYFHYVGYSLGCDIISYGLILLSFWIGALMITASQSVLMHGYYSKLFLCMVVGLTLMLYLTFSSMNLFMFYLFFEASLIPTLLLILGWGYQPERVQAGMYLLFYTLTASLPLLLGIFHVYSFGGSLFFPFLVKGLLSLNVLFYLVMIFAFLVKMPMFLVHLWLPKAHVEAPVSGSMILAGVLLKLGGYGLLRMLNLLSSMGLLYNYCWVSISLIGGCLISFICLRQTDLKALVAYSSVAHMGLVLGGMMTMSYWGICGAYTLMIAHGLCSSGMFCLTNISYERLGSRSILLNKGLMHFMPSMTLWWFLLSSANMAAPPTLNLLGEISLLNSLVGWCWVSMLTLMLLSFFSAAYTLYLYSYSQHGKFYSGLYSCSSGLCREYLLLFLHWVPLNVLIMKSDSVILWV